MTTKRPHGSTGKPRKSLSLPGLVYRYWERVWESREKKEKDQGRQEGGSSEGNVPCALNQESLFLVHEYWGSEVTHLGWSINSYETSSTRKPCAKAVLETDSLTQQKQYHKRTTLRTTKILLQSIRSKEGPHYHLSEAQKRCHLTSDKCHIWHGYVEDFAAKHS
jgi:hypothetical protein